MPLLLLCGYPCSGKTALAERLRAHFASQGRACVVVAEAHSASFNTTATEDKTARSALRSEVQRLLSQTTLVIVDAANEVKGFRYELFCLARACKTPHAVLHVATPLEACIARCTAQIVAQENSEGQAHGQTERQIQTQAEAELSESQTQAASAITVPSSVGLQQAEEWLRARAARFEPPDSRNRWDSPLFTLAPEDELPLQALAAALYERQAPPPHASTRGQPLTDTNFIHELDSTTQEIVAALVEAQRSAVIGDKIAVPNTDAKVVLRKTMTLLALRQVQRQFITYSKMHPVADRAAIARLFVDFINNSQAA